MNEKTNFKYINLSPFKWFVLENFPFLEADFDALTEWQLFCKLGKEINKIIESQNLVGKQAEELTNAFNDLQNYINNYFENLDVQEEINNKLNEMVTDGTFNNIINNELFTNLNEKVENLDNSVINLNEKVENLDNAIINQNYGILFAGRDMNEFDPRLGRTSFYWSNDGINLFKIGTTKDFKFDAHALTHINDFYYCFGDNSYYYSKDLINWNYSGDNSIYPEITTGDIWASMLFNDPKSNNLYVYSGYRYKIENSTNYFKIVYKKCTQLENGLLSFENNFNDFLFIGNSSYNDPYMYYDKVHGYIFACANRNNFTLDVYHALSPETIGDLIIETRQYEVEAPQLCGSGNGDIVMYCDFNNLQEIFGEGYKNCDGRFTLTQPSINNSTFPANNYFFNADIVKTSDGYARHLSPLKCDKNTFQKIKEIGIFPLKTYSSYVKGNNILSDSISLDIIPSTSNSEYTKVLLYDFIRPIIKIRDEQVHFVRFYSWFNHSNDVVIDISTEKGKLFYMPNSEIKSECRNNGISGNKINRFTTVPIGNLSTSYPTDFVVLPYD